MFQSMPCRPVVAAAAVLTMAMVAPSGAAVISVEPDEFAPLTDLTTAVPGVRATIDGQPTFHMISLDNFGAGPSTGTHYFGVRAPGGYTAVLSLGTPLRFDFDTGTAASSASIDFVASAFSGPTVARLSAFDAAGTLLDSKTVTMWNSGQVGTASVSAPGFSIAYVIAGLDPSTTGVGNADHFTANVGPVPEPALLGLVPAVVLPLLRHRRRR